VKSTAGENDSCPLPSGRDCLDCFVDVKCWRDFVRDLKQLWGRMWRERIDDKLRAEGIANRDYSLLFVEQGTVIIATRDYKPLNFREIVEQYKVPNIDKVVQPPPTVGGWGKFIRTKIVGQRVKRRKELKRDDENHRKRQLLKKGGRGWLHSF